MKIKATIYISDQRSWGAKTYTREFEDETDLEDRLEAWAESDLVFVRANGLVTAAFPWRRVYAVEITRTPDTPETPEPGPDPNAYKGRGA